MVYFNSSDDIMQIAGKTNFNMSLFKFVVSTNKLNVCLIYLHMRVLRY